METIEEIKYKGKVIKIYQDEDAQSPEGWDNNVFIVSYHNDFYVAKDEIITKSDLAEYFNGEKIPQTKDYHIFLVYAYIHSGVSLSLSNEKYPFTDAWDVSRCSAILVSKEEAKTRKQAERMAKGLIETWNDFLGGNIYGYDTGNDSCWGFYGDIEKSGMIEQAESDIDIEIEKETKKHLKKLKAYILNRVPFEKRVALMA